MSRQLIVIDPASHTPEVDTFNLISRLSPLPATYHLPQLLGMGTLDGVEEAGGLIILGSAASVVDHPAWQTTLEKWIRPHWEAKVPCLAICWGHQWVAQVFGGKVGFLRPDREKLQGFRAVQFKDNRWMEGEGELFVSHREVVTDLPKGFRRIAFSDLEAIEAMEHESLPLWALQPHPESTPEFLKNQKSSPAAPSQLAFGHQLVQAFLKQVR